MFGYTRAARLWFHPWPDGSFQNAAPCSRSTFSEPNSVSEQALSQQFPLRLIEGMMAYSLSTLLKSSLAYWLPRSLWKISLLF